MNEDDRSWDRDEEWDQFILDSLFAMAGIIILIGFFILWVFNQ